MEASFIPPECCSSRQGARLCPPEPERYYAYEFTYDRRGEHMQRMFGAYRGYLQAKAHAGFNALYQDRGNRGCSS
ncbi:MAG: transposase [Betaproteobacteria bacterium]|nr:transposase [Betaproteobacteria bacterium]